MDCDEDADTRHIRVLPDACVELFISYTSTPVAVIGHDLYKKSIITFRMSRPMDVQMRKGAGCLAICFQPGMAYRFLHVPMHVFTDTTTLLNDVWKNAAEVIEAKLADADSNALRVSIVQEYLLKQLAQSHDDETIARCLQLAQFAAGTVSVHQLTNLTGLSQRHLARRFQQCIGLSPATYLRVARFIKSLQYLRNYPGRSLTDVAYESGYYDQAHFIRDYKTFAGFTPGEVAQSQAILY
jgi:AraC-like DNA-binding protein